MYNVESLNLTLKPTPLQKLEYISKIYNCDIYLKRDDLLGIGFGGNKLRKLEYNLADAKRKNAKVIVTSGALQTNHGMLTALCASKLKMDCILFLFIEESKDIEGLSGNLLLDDYIGCKVEMIYVADIVENEGLTKKEKDDLVQIRFKEKEKEVVGKYLKENNISENEVYYIYKAGSTPLGILGYVDCVKEITAQTRVKFDYLFSGLGTGGTYSGLVLGAKMYMPDTKVIGVGVNEMNSDKQQFMLDLIEEGKKYLPAKYRDIKVELEDMEFLQNCVNNGYAIPDDETMEVVEKMARTEGVFFDPIYSGKIINGVLKYIKNNNVKEGSKILVLHSGGIAGIFNQSMVKYRTKNTKILKMKSDF